MLKKIAVLLFVLLIAQMAMYARLYAEDLMDQATSLTNSITGVTQENKEQDASEYIQSLGIPTRVNETALEEKHPGTRLYTDPMNGNTTIEFSNEKDNRYRLDIYAVNEGLVASFVNISSEKVVIDKQMFAAGAYIYKLSGEANIFCGTFVMR